MRLAILSMALTVSLPVPAAVAADLTVYGGAALTFAPGGDAATRTDFNAYVEADLANFYLGASVDIYNDKVSDEVDLSLGYRNTTASGLSYDLSYTRNFYPNDGGDCCGDVALSLSHALTEKFTGTFDLNYYPEDKTSDAYITLDYALNDKITLTSSFGIIQNAGTRDTRDAELAISYALGEETAAKLHYYDGSDYEGYFALDLTWDTTLFGG
jgi:outer membrane usher protein FimD/PapC